MSNENPDPKTYHHHTEKKKIKFSSYIRKFRVEQLQSYMRKGFLIYEQMRKYFPVYEEAVIYDFANAPFWISLYMRKILFPFVSVQRHSDYRSAVNFSRGLQPWRTQDHTLGQVRKIWAVWLLHLPPWFLLLQNVHLSLITTAALARYRAASLVPVANELL